MRERRVAEQDLEPDRRLGTFLVLPVVALWVHWLLAHLHDVVPELRLLPLRLRALCRSLLLLRLEPE